MVTAKTNLFEKEFQEKAIFFKALAHPARLQILQYLLQTRICLTGDISDMFPLSRTTLNQHMCELKNAGLIVGHKQEGKIYYCLNHEKMKEMLSILSVFLDEIHLSDNFCCEFGDFKHTH